MLITLPSIGCVVDCTVKLWNKTFVCITAEWAVWLVGFVIMKLATISVLIFAVDGQATFSFNGIEEGGEVGSGEAEEEGVGVGVLGFGVVVGDAKGEGESVGFGEMLSVIVFAKK